MHGINHQPHILALDDSPAILTLYQELLGDERYRVSTGSYASYDLDQIATVRPDVVILDFMWGDSMDPVSALEALRADSRINTIPLVLCTGAQRQVEPIRPQLEEMGVQVVSKPFDIDALLRAVAQSLARAPRL